VDAWDHVPRHVQLWCTLDIAKVHLQHYAFRASWGKESFNTAPVDASELIEQISRNKPSEESRVTTSA
jgi:hypothetical protein